MHDLFLQRCHELAAIPGSAVEPNPRVGAVVVHEGNIIGEGFHAFFGGPHAEVNAIRAVIKKELLPSATIYVSLEPCNHFGKTPPCADLIVEVGIRKVVIAALDPNPQMAGKSVAALRAKGIEVILANQNHVFESQNKHFICNQKYDRPFVTLKWAQSLDGFMADENPPTQISNKQAARFVHALRHNHQAILIGSRTAEIDNPRLDTRLWPGRSPLKIVVDPSLSLNPELKLFQTGEICVLNGIKEGQEGNIRFVKIAIPLNWPDLLKKLYAEFKVGSILVEGGAQVHTSLLQTDCWDEIYVDTGEIELHSGLKAPEIPNLALKTEAFRVGKDLFEVFIPKERS